MKRFFNKMQYVKIKDVFSIFLMVLSLPYALFLRKTRPHIWLICEDGYEARDNGYWLYRYICMKKVQTDAVYVIAKTSPDYIKIMHLNGKSIPPFGIKHWAYYLAAENNISSQKSGKPNAAVCYFFEVYGLWKNRRIFLQHGIVHNNVDFLHYSNSKMSMFICGAKPEYEYVKKYFGYPKGSVRYLGMARYDGLQHFETRRIILIMPSWRKYIATPGYFSKRLDTPTEFIQTSYFKAWDQFLTDPELNEILRKNNYQIIFYPHRNMQRFIGYFKTNSPYIQVAGWHNNDVQDLLKESMFMITDYSSVAMDFAYMGKPLLYYQFDLNDFRKYQYAAGYFDYADNGFGPVCYKYEEVKRQLLRYMQNDFKNIEPYNIRSQRFFELHDGNNCQRIYEAILENSRAGA